GRLIELRAHVPDLATFRERLGWLRRVSAEEWLDAMPPQIVKSVDYVATAEEAEAVLRGAESWPIFREMEKEGAYPATVIEYAEKMPSRKWFGRPLLPEVDKGLGCAEKGYPAVVGQ